MIRVLFVVFRHVLLILVVSCVDAVVRGGILFRDQCGTIDMICICC